MEDRELARRLRAGDEAAFREVVARFGGRLARLARSFCRSEAVIEEAVQETWMAVIRGIHGYQGRAPFQSWLFGILVNQARRHGVSEHRHARVTPASGALARADPAYESDDEREPGMGATGAWVDPPAPWGLEDPASALLTRETLAVLEAALESLPESQRAAVILRDVEGLGAEETCNILGVSDTHQRVLLHRGRSRLRQALDRYLREGEPGAVRRDATRKASP